MVFRWQRGSSLRLSSVSETHPNCYHVLSFSFVSVLINPLAPPSHQTTTGNRQWWNLINGIPLLSYGQKCYVKYNINIYILTKLTIFFHGFQSYLHDCDLSMGLRPRDNRWLYTVLVVWFTDSKCSLLFSWRLFWTHLIFYDWYWHHINHHC